MAPLAQMAQVGVVLYMFLVGVELDFEHARAQVRSTSGVALAGVVVPVVLGALLATRLDPVLMPDGPPLWQAALFLGVAMAMTAFPVLARILADTGLMATPLGTRALVVRGDGRCDRLGRGGRGGRCVRAAAPMRPCWRRWSPSAFVVGMLVVVRPLVTRAAPSRVGRGSLGLPLALVAVLVVALVAEAAGVHAVVGAFLLGIGVPHESVLAVPLRLAAEPGRRPGAAGVLCHRGPANARLASFTA